MKGSITNFNRHQHGCDVCVAIQFILPTLVDSFTKSTALCSVGAGIPRVVLKRDKTGVFRSGHPMVYSTAIERVVGKPEPEAGDCVLVTDGSERPIAWGVFNPVSRYRVRYAVHSCSVSCGPSNHVSRHIVFAIDKT